MSKFDAMIGTEVRVSGKTFDYSKKLKACGFRFDSATKSWIGKVNIQATHFLSQDGLVVSPLRPMAPAVVATENEGYAAPEVDRTPYSPGE